MKTISLAALSAFSLVTFAQDAMASDLGLAPASYDWSGPYMGVTSGGAMNASETSWSFDHTRPRTAPQAVLDAAAELGGSFSDDSIAYTGGISAGYNWQGGGFVLGLEADINYLGFEGSRTFDATNTMSGIFGAAPTYADHTLSYEMDRFGTLRGRLGYAADNFLLYGTGGLAYGRGKASSYFDAATPTDRQSASWSDANRAWQFGWTAGAGIEYGVDNWVLGLEYLYVDLGSVEMNAEPDVSLTAGDADWEQVNLNGEMDMRFNVLRASAKFRF